jgi:D-glycero-D-manno-heptose 1,7-bisphosphate phosphatase
MKEPISKRPAIFLDRDGTLIEDQHYPRDPKKVRWMSGTESALKDLQKLGFVLFVVSNQSGVGRGIISDSEFRAVHERFCELLKESGIEVQEFAYCFHRPEDLCKCRKPETKLIHDLAKTHSIDLGRSYTVGDKWSDVLMGFRSGAQGILLSLAAPEPAPQELGSQNQSVFSTWPEVVDFIRRPKKH